MSQNIPRDPEVIPDYREVAPIHESDTARIFYAADRAGELVVVKQLTDEGVVVFDESPVKKSFLQEAEILEGLDHPQIPRLLANNTDHFSPHFVMAPVGGYRDLRQFKHISDPLAASRIAYSALEPLGYVHSQGIVHMDIKPQNILARWIGPSMLNDFGVSNRLGDINLMGGTLPYMSPEHARGQDVGVTTDIYGMGITLFALLYGRTPYEPDSLSDLREWQVHDRILFPSAPDRNVPVPLIEVVERATQKNPSDRYQSAEEMQEGLSIAVAAAGNSPFED